MARRRLPPEIALEIVSMDSAGLGIGEFEGKAVKVKNGLPGESVSAKVVGRKRNYFLAEAFDHAKTHPSRVTGGCENFPRCGGCSLWHLDYSAQLEFKQQMLTRELGNADVEFGILDQPVSGPQSLYRRKARLGVRKLDSGLLVGFRESFSNRVGRMSDCRTLVEPFASSIPKIIHHLTRLSAPDTIPQIELAAGDEAAVMIIRHLQPFDGDDIQRLHWLQAETGIAVLVQPGGLDTVVPLVPSEQTLTQMLSYKNLDYGLNFWFSPTDFTQVNGAINRLLVRTAVSYLNIKSASVVADLFCGIGNFSLPLAKIGARVIGVESSATAIKQAEYNARANGLAQHCEFRVGDLYDQTSVALSDALSANPNTSVKDWLATAGVTHLLLDPPRSGAGPNLQHWLTDNIERIVYVSCNPTTFATDAAVLVQSGFQLTRVGIFDMFPHTAHVETLGVFDRARCSAAKKNN